MKQFLLFLLLTVLVTVTAQAQINVGSTAPPDSSAMLQISGTAKGFLPPRMTRDSMYLIHNPAKGLLVFNTTDSLFYFKRDSGWTALAAGDEYWFKNGNSLYNTNSNVGIGTSSPSTALHVVGNNPLTLNGVQPGTSTSSDSVLTINNGLVTELPLSTFAASSNGITTADAPLTYTSGEIGITPATTNSDGYLYANDWNIFNNKVNSIALTANVLYPTTSFTVTGGAATATLPLNTQAANKVFAGPVSGGSLAPSFRALVAADLPKATTSLVGGVSVGSGLSVTGSGVLSVTNPSAGGSVTSASVVSANGLAGTVANATTTPAITLSTTVTGMVKGNGTALSTATSGTDYAPGTGGNTTGIVKSTTGTGALTTATASDFPTLNQNTTGTAANITGVLNATSQPALTGDVTNTAGSVATTISNNVVTNAKLATMPANTFKANNTGATAAPADITGTQATAMLDVFISTTKGLVPASGGGTANFLRADGTFAVPPGTNTNAGTVTSVAVTSANGVSGTVATATTTPAISLTLGAITPSSVAATGTVTGSNLSGTNTGDETNATIKTKLGPATSTTDGYLTQTDWNTFNNKASTANVISSLNGLTATSQTFATPGTTGTAPAWVSSGSAHTLNIPLASATGVTAGLLSNADWTTFNNKATTTGTWSTTGNAGTSSATNFLGTTDSASLRFRTSNTQRMIIDSLGNAAVGTTVFDNTNPEKFLINAGNTNSVNGLVAKGSINNYFQFNIKNSSNGVNATSDIVATADNGSETTNYVDLGINGSGYTGSAIQTGIANDGYLISSGNDFYVVNSTANKNMLFLTGGTGVANERMRILANGYVGMGVQNPTAEFVVKDTMEIRRTGSLSQLLFTNTAGTGDLRIGGDGGDLYWQGGGSRNLQMGSYWTTVLGGDRQGQGGAYPAFINGTGGTGVLVQSQRDASVPLAIQSYSATQSSNLTEWRNASGTVLSAVNNNGYFGIGTSSPATALHVSAASNPLTLNGVQTGSNTDSILAITNGTVKKLSPSALSVSSSNAWELTGNTNTLSNNYFLGTTNSDPLIFKVNSQLAGRLDASNTYLGTAAGYNNGTTANQNTGIGYQALSSNTSGTYNTAIGYNALQGNATGSNNIGVGYGAAVANNSSNSIAIGVSSYVNNASSIAMGTSAQTNNTSGLAIGNYTYINGINGIAIGNGTSSARTQGYGNYSIALGYSAYAGSANSIAIGDTVNSNASNSIAIGHSSAATVANSTALGASASAAGNNSTAIGYNAAVASDNTIILGDKSNTALSVGIGSEAFSNGNREKLLVDAGNTSSFNVISGKGNLNNYLQLNIQNKNAGTAASSDLVATADNGDENNNYVDLGINSSANTANYFGGADDAYLYAQTQNMLIGTASAAKSVVFLTGGGTQSTNERMRIDGSGNVGIGTNAPSTKLQVSSTANPLSLLGVQTGANTDSLLTITGGVVRKLPVATFASPTNSWSTTGNSNTLSNNYFLGTTNTDPLIFKMNNQLMARLDTVNTFLGYQSGYNNSTTATQGTGIGYHALFANTSGTYNTAIGYNSLYNNVSGSNNVGIGYKANVSGNNSNSVAIGSNSIVNNGNSIAVGASAQTNNTSAIAIGNNTYATGVYSTAIGSGTSSTKARALGDTSLALGYDAAAGGSNSIAIGKSSKGNLVNSTAVGALAGATGSNSTAVGASAYASGANSTAVGYNAIASSDNTILIGDKSNSSLSVAIGSESFSSGNREKLLVDAGTTSSFNVISGKGNINNYLQLNIQNNNAGTAASSDIVATADNGNETSNYVDLGINSSANTANFFGAANDAYLYAQSQNILIGTASAGKSVVFLTGGGTQSTNERMRIDSIGRVGIGTNAPATALHVVGTNPLTLNGVATGTSTSADSILTITSGLVKKIPMATFASPTNSWSTAGNAGTTSVSNFLGTTDNNSMSFKTNNTWRMRLDSAGGLFIGDSASSYTNTVSNTNAGLRSDWTTSLTSGDVPRIALQGQMRANLTTTSGSAQIRGFNGSALVGVNSGVSSNADIYGGYFLARRQTATGITEGTGTLNILSGAGIEYGHTSSANSGGTTTNVFGIKLIPFYAAGTITNMYGLYAGTPTGGGNVTNYYDIYLAAQSLTGVTNSWGIYQANTKNNYFGGNVGIGTTTPATALQVSAATNPLTLNGVATGTNTSSDSLLTITSGLVRKLPLSTFANAANAWSTTGNAGTSYSTNFLGTTDNTSLRFRTSNTQRMIMDSLGSVGIGSNPTFTASPNRESLLVDAGGSAGNTNYQNVIVGKGNTNSYAQLNIQNSNAGANASSDVVATADNGNENSNYVDLGINSSTNSGNTFGAANDAYLYAQSQNILIGTASAGKSVVFLTGGGTQSTNERMRIDSIGRVGIGTNAPADKFDVVGTGGTLVSAFNSTAASDRTIVAVNNTASNGGSVGLRAHGSSYSENILGNNAAGTSSLLAINAGNGLLTIGTYNAGDVVLGTNNAERMRISGSNGNVGIGTTSPNSTLSVSGSMAVKYRTGLSGNQTISVSDYTLINTGAAATWTLPAANTCAGRVYILVNDGTGNITLSVAVTTSNGVTSTSLSNTAGSNNYQILSDGTNWIKIN